MTGTLPGYLSKDLAKLHKRAMRMYISGSERAGKQFTTLKREGNWSRNASRNCFWDRYWRRSSQPLASFFLLVPSNSPRSLLTRPNLLQSVPTCTTRSAQTQHTVSANNSQIYVYASIHYEGRELLSYRDAKRKDARTSHVFIAYYSIWSRFFFFIKTSWFIFLSKQI